MSAASRTPSLTPSRSPSPAPPVQPDHFYGSEGVPLPPSPNSDGKTWLDPADDPLASRGIPVFKPTMDEFNDFEDYMNKIECWGMRSGIVKVIPPKQWKDALPPLTDQLAKVKLHNPIQQAMIGVGGRFQQQNIEKRRVMSVREWAELCGKEGYCAPGVDDVGLQRSAAISKPRARRNRDATASAEAPGPVRVKSELPDDDDVLPPTDARQSQSSLASPPASEATPASPDRAASERLKDEDDEQTMEESKPKEKGRRQGPSREAREAREAERAALDAAFLENFDPDSDWLPNNTTPFDYTPEFCQKLERQFWRNIGFGKDPWYAADMKGSLFTDETTAWNVAHLPSLLDRISRNRDLPGVNTPYLYFGMWRATFAWHVEDMDLFSINYIHFGAGKFWYAVPQGRAGALEQTMRGHFPSNCPQFLRHKSYLASPNVLSSASCRPNTLVQNSGEFVITYPRGYHAGFNMGFNCAESVNFALNSWLELGRKAKACNCVDDSVRIDVDELLNDYERDGEAPEPVKRDDSAPPAKFRPPPRKRKSDASDRARKPKKIKTEPASSSKSPSSSKPGSSTGKITVTLKLGPRPKDPEPFPCCLCVSMSEDDLLPVQDPPTAQHAAHTDTKVWRAHAGCAKVVPETWIDESEVGPVREDGTRATVRVVLGVDAIVKDRWNLKCSACSKNRSKQHGAPIQCTKGKCPKAFHISCAREGGENNIVYEEVREVEKEVVAIDTSAPAPMVVDAVGFDFRTVPSEALDALNAQTLKTVKKIEVTLLCAQHNPAIAEAKKNNKQDKIRKELLALQPMARIKLRVSAGIVEVSLVRVIEETCSVEVLWDRGIKREFKWGSVVFGNTDGHTIVQKPSVAAPEPERTFRFL
ncbi:JmjC-domain-containing protein [Auriscalpium vulgare]|uniref:JmjC-domain-containing protein n=1 Tax=Auriscalpium vulgare TaxID=40419 RepID=A0ACB8RH71_9AGAM|nr:JmjC-domain-containing protein [Auriscalpium vulgare]